MYAGAGSAMPQAAQCRSAPSSTRKGRALRPCLHELCSLHRSSKEVADALHQLSQGRLVAVRRSVLVSAVAVDDKVPALLDSTRAEPAAVCLCVPVRLWYRWD